MTTRSRRKMRTPPRRSRPRRDSARGSAWLTGPACQMRGRAGSALALLLDLRLLAAQLAQVVQLRATHVTARHDLDLVDRGRVDREGPLDADLEGDLADREGL